MGMFGVCHSSVFGRVFCGPCLSLGAVPFTGRAFHPVLPVNVLMICLDAWLFG